jgi:predicted enzyme related to lactoylglutathione lyase
MTRPVHFEIHASVPEKVVAFYTEMFGWKIVHLPELTYWTIDTGNGEGINGGLMRRHGPKPPDDSPVNAYVCSIGISDVDAYMAHALKAGATVALPKMTIPGVGYQGYVKDPDGNIFGLHQPDRSAK